MHKVYLPRDTSCLTLCRMSASGKLLTLGLLLPVDALRLPAPSRAAARKWTDPVMQQPSLYQREVLEPDYRLAAGSIGAGGALTLSTLGLAAPLGLPLGALGLFLASRARVVRFAFEEEALEIMSAGDEGQLENTAPNFAVGGRNRWSYDAIQEWAMYPSPEAPVLVYFRETQTKASGQGHLFPILMDPIRLRQLMSERVGEARRVTGSPKLS